jgi:hypothetical protein
MVELVWVGGKKGDVNRIFSISLHEMGRFV